jgi:hypothetical protein
MDRAPHRLSHQQQHNAYPKAPGTNVHTNILGRDSADLDGSSSTSTTVSSFSSRDGILTPSRSNRTVTVPPPSSKSSNSRGSSSHRRSHDTSLLAKEEPPPPARSNSKLVTTTISQNSVPAGLGPTIQKMPTRAHSPDMGGVYDTISDAESNTNEGAANNGKQQGKHWWGKRLWGLGTSDENDNDSSDESHYDRMEAPLEDGQYSAASAIVPALTSSISSASQSLRAVATVEDQLKQDCSFFYQGMEEVSSPPGHAMGGHKTMQKGSNLRRSRLSNTLKNLPRQRIISTRDGTVFMSKYERLNQEIALDEDEYNDDTGDLRTSRLRSSRKSNNDLFLTEYSGSGDLGTATASLAYSSRHNSMAPDSVVTDTLHSNLIYEQDGRVLMKLPRDQVRLMMDSDLEPGILSVEQWRKRQDVIASEQERIFRLEGGLVDDDLPSWEDPLTTKGGGQQPLSTVKKLMDDDDDDPELYYVLTVPDDLYRRVVSEMSYAAHPPCWGFVKCCRHESEKADIKLALLLLSIIMLLMMIGSLEWATE